MSDSEAKCYAATPAATLQQHVMDCRIAKSEAEWWAKREIERLRSELEQISDHARTRRQDGISMGATVWKIALEEIVKDVDEALKEGAK